MKERAGVLGIDLLGTPPERLAIHMKAEITRWNEVAKDANLKLD